MTHVGRLKDRPTSEVVILVLAFVIAISVLFTPPAVLIVDVMTDRDTRQTIESYVNLMNVIVGAVVGYISARHSAMGDPFDSKPDSDVAPPTETKGPDL